MATAQERTLLRVELPADDHHRALIACQVACPVHTDARGYGRAIAEGRLEAAYLIARGPNPFASICGGRWPRALLTRVGPRPRELTNGWTPRGLDAGDGCGACQLPADELRA